MHAIRLAAVTAALAVPLAAVGAQVRPAPARSDTVRADTIRSDTTRRPLATRAELDSLAARLARAEAEIALLRQQLATESESAVRTRSRFALELSARVLANTSWTSRPTDDLAVPSVAVPETEARAGASVGVSVRQTRLGAALTVRDVLGGTLEGDVDVDFYGGTRDAAGDLPLFPEPRLRTARAWLRWPSGFAMIGADTPLVSALDPLSLAAVGVPLFAGAGNLWNWLPQVRVSRELGHRGTRLHGPRLAVQGAVLLPYAGTAYDPTATTGTSGPSYATAVGVGGDAAARSGRPSLEGRLRARWGTEDADAAPGDAAAQADVRDFGPGEGPNEVGIGFHRGWLRLEDVGLLSTSAATLDARIAFARRFELRGEAYAGQLVAGLGGGAVGQNFGQPAAGAPAGTLGPAVRTVAAWAQVNAQATRTLLAGAGCGVDRPRDADRPDRRQNLVCATHLRWRPAQPLLLGFEYRRLATRYAGGRTFSADHLNLALGFEL